jgi:Protein of unknown function (DUF2786)
MPALPADIKAKIASLLRLQASDNDGERANASAAITRLLQRYGADWHDLAAVLLSEPQAAPAASATTGAAPASSWKRSAGALDLPRGELLNLIEIIEARTPFLSLNSTSSVRCANAHGGRWCISPKNNRSGFKTCSNRRECRRHA